MGVEMRLVMIPSLSKLGDGYKVTCFIILPNFVDV